MFQEENNLLCRLCLSSCSESIDIFDPKGRNGLLIWTVLKELLQLDVTTGDGLPSTICNGCLGKVTDFKYFKTMCINSRIEFLKAMANRGLVSGASEAILPFPRSSLETRLPLPTAPSVPTPEIVEISEDSKDSLSSVRAMVEGNALVTIKKSSSRTSREDEEEDEEDEYSGESMDDGGSSVGGEDDNSSVGENDVSVVDGDEEGEGEEGGGEEDESTDCKQEAQQFKCPEPDCGRDFETMRALRIHSTFVHYRDKSVGKGGVSWGCPFCRHKAESRKLLAHHVKAMHKENSDEDGDRPKRKSIKGSDWKKSKVVDVSRKLSPKVLLRDCMDDAMDVDNKPLIARGKSPQVARVSTATQKAGSEGTTPTSNRMLTFADLLFCNMCLMPFQDQASLDAHTDRVHGRGNCYICYKCSKSFSSYQGIQKHSQMHLERKELAFCCTRCCRVFPSLTRMREHAKSSHGFVKPATCEVCRCCFLSSRAMEKHKCQLFPNLFPCPLCGRIFRHKRYVRSHLKSCKGTDEEGGEGKN